jgi:hypothetical protein
LGVVDSFGFDFHSSDTGNFGINTPLYFCIDNFNDLASKLIAAKSDLQFSLFPNPASAQIHIQMNGQIDGYTVIDMQGKMILQGTEKTIDIAALPMGVYVIQIKVGDAVLHQKFIKE